MSMQLHHDLPGMALADLALEGGAKPSRGWFETAVTVLAATAAILFISCSSVALALN